MIMEIADTIKDVKRRQGEKRTIGKRSFGSRATRRNGQMKLIG